MKVWKSVKNWACGASCEKKKKANEMHQECRFYKELRLYI